MIISELNILLLAKGEIYTIDGFTKSNIDTFIKLIATDKCFCTCIYVLYLHVYILCVLYIFMYGVPFLCMINKQ